MRLINIPWVRTLLSSVILFLVVVSYCHYNFYRDPGSLFYDEERAFEREYSAYRQKEAEHYIEQASSYGSREIQKAGTSPKICATFVSVKRDGKQYLPLAVASALQGLRNEERSDLLLNVFIANVNSTHHPSSQIQWLHDVLDNIYTYDVSDHQVEKLQNLEETKDFAQKAVFDYTYALEKCYESQAPWVAMLEDDIILADGWYIHTLQGLRGIEQRSNSAKRDWLFMRLFNQERSTGWASRSLGQNHEVLISVGLLIPTWTILALLRRSSKTFRRHLDNPSLAIICLLVIPAFVGLFFQAGKASLLPPRPGVHDEPFGCCSQALVFPSYQVPRIREYLLQRRSGQIDLMLDDFARENHLIRYALYPVQLQHIGTRSVRGTLAREAQAIWSMAFERQDPKKLHTQHHALVQSIYGV